MKYKLFVFDLDETLWAVSGGLCNLIEEPFRMETPDRLVGKNGLWVELFPDVRKLLDFLRDRGAYISLASRNDRAPTLKLLEGMGIAEYFRSPQLCWKPKDESIKKVIREIQRKDKVTIKPEEVLFVDDWPENIGAVRKLGATAIRPGHPQFRGPDPDPREMLGRSSHEKTGPAGTLTGGSSDSC
jgi:magnesium-dependent phosphatase-1